ncbi:MAG TPA: sulfurtransferase [Actinomycetales bacterium]|nr:sulfurtransferase [Actinomycetales bacterium]
MTTAGTRGRGGAAADPQDAAGAGTVEASGSEPGPLVDAGWLAERLKGPGTTLLHVDGDSSGYYSAHLPNALPLDWHDELHERVGRRPLTLEHFEELMRRRGIEPDTHVVLYGTGDGAFAAHAYWLFRYYQHPRVSLLDGGLRAWTRAGGALVEAVPRVKGGGSYRSPGPDPSLRVGRDEMITRYAGAPDGTVVLDSRTPQEFAGKHRHPLDLGLERHRVGGRVPGARNLPTARLLAPDGAFRPADELQQLFAEFGVREHSDVVVYCRAGEGSSVPWFALHELLGHTRVRHYDGGWAEYGSLMDVPVELGD